MIVAVAMSMIVSMSMIMDMPMIVVVCVSVVFMSVAVIVCFVAVIFFYVRLTRIFEVRRFVMTMAMVVVGMAMTKGERNAGNKQKYGKRNH